MKHHVQVHGKVVRFKSQTAKERFGTSLADRITRIGSTTREIAETVGASDTWIDDLVIGRYNGARIGGLQKLRDLLGPDFWADVEAAFHLPGTSPARPHHARNGAASARPEPIQKAIRVLQCPSCGCIMSEDRP